MRSPFVHEHYLDDIGNPEGGVSYGNGFCISWQRGPLGRGEDRKQPNGAFVEDIIDAALKRILFYQSSKFACTENQQAAIHLSRALDWLNKRTESREERGVEGTHQP